MAYLRVYLGFAAASSHVIVVGAGGAPGPWTTAGLYQNSRAMDLVGLTPGAMYNFQIRAVGGSAGYSQWSNPVGHRSL